MRLYRNRQGLTKGKKNPKGKKGQQKPAKPKHDPNHRTRPELALELIIMVAQWFPNQRRSSSPVTALQAVKASTLSPAAQRSPLISHVHPNGTLYNRAPPKENAKVSLHREEPVPHIGDEQQSGRHRSELQAGPVGLSTTLKDKNKSGPPKAGKDSFLTVILVTRNVEGKRPIRMLSVKS